MAFPAGARLALLAGMVALLRPLAIRDSFDADSVVEYEQELWQDATTSPPEGEPKPQEERQQPPAKPPRGKAGAIERIQAYKGEKPERRHSVGTSDQGMKDERKVAKEKTSLARKTSFSAVTYQRHPSKDTSEVSPEVPPPSGATEAQEYEWEIPQKDPATVLKKGQIVMIIGRNDKDPDVGNRGEHLNGKLAQVNEYLSQSSTWRVSVFTGLGKEEKYMIPIKNLETPVGFTFRVKEVIETLYGKLEKKDEGVVIEVKELRGRSLRMDFHFGIASVMSSDFHKLQAIQVDLHKGYLRANFNMQIEKRRVQYSVAVKLHDFPKLWIVEDHSTPDKLQHLLQRMKAGVLRDSSEDTRRTSTGSTQQGYRPSAGLRPWTAEQAWTLPEGHSVLVRCSEVLCTQRGWFGYYYHGKVATQAEYLVTVDVTRGKNGPYAGKRITVDARPSDLPIAVPERLAQERLKMNQIVWVHSQSAGRWVRARVTFVNGADVYLVYLDWLAVGSARGTPRKYDDKTISLKKPEGAFYVGQQLRVMSKTDRGRYVLAQIVALSPQVVEWRGSYYNIKPNEIEITYLEGKHVDPTRQPKLKGDLKILVPKTEGDQKNIIDPEATVRQLPLTPQDRHVSLSSSRSASSLDSRSLSTSSSSSSVSQATVKCHELQKSRKCYPVSDSNTAIEARVGSQRDCLRFCEDKNAACCMMVPMSLENTEWKCTAHSSAVLTKGAESEFGSACGDEDTMAAVHATPRRVPKSKCQPRFVANHECPQASSSYVLVLPPGNGNCLQLCAEHGAHCCQWNTQDCIGRWYRGVKSIIGLIVSEGRQASMCEPEDFESGQVYSAMQSFSVRQEPHKNKGIGYYVEAKDQGEVLQVDVEGNAMLDFEETLGPKWVPHHDLRMFKKMAKQASRRSSKSVDSSLVQLSDEFQESELGLVELLSDGNASSWHGGGAAVEVALDPHGRQLAFRSKAEAHNG